ncbi:MAG: hypothetical protein N5P05_004397 (plasmid) [Chroococcopsis gigantea SAG 12.99]|jgi:hypothetical protein|nr:hypothetical protein [Chroococcopsis gigantea SAG 12.99]
MSESSSSGLLQRVQQRLFDSGSVIRAEPLHRHEILTERTVTPLLRRLEIGEAIEARYRGEGRIVVRESRFRGRGEPGETLRGKAIVNSSVPPAENYGGEKVYRVENEGGISSPLMRVRKSAPSETDFSASSADGISTPFADFSTPTDSAYPREFPSQPDIVQKNSERSPTENYSSEKVYRSENEGGISTPLMRVKKSASLGADFSASSADGISTPFANFLTPTDSAYPREMPSKLDTVQKKSDRSPVENYDAGADDEVYGQLKYMDVKINSIETSSSREFSSPQLERSTPPIQSPPDRIVQMRADPNLEGDRVENRGTLIAGTRGQNLSLVKPLSAPVAEVRKRSLSLQPDSIPTRPPSDTERTLAVNSPLFTPLVAPAIVQRRETSETIVKAPEFPQSAQVANAEPDINDIAERVSHLLWHRQRIEKERRGGY